MSERRRQSAPAHAPAAAAGRGRARAAASANGSGIAAGGVGDGEAREVEWQLTAPDLGVVRRWLEQHRSLDQLSIEPLPVQQLHDTYLDTEDWRVFRAGFALRLREKEGRAEATLKGLRSARDDVADRREITEPLPESRRKALIHATGPVGTRVRDVAGARPLRTLFEVSNSRQRFAVLSRNPVTLVGEIALDEARFSRGSGRRRPMLLTRVELEAVGHDSARLERLAERLRTECGLCRATENKFAVGLRSASLAPPHGAGPDPELRPAPAVMSTSTRASDFAAEVLRRLVREWQVNEPVARLGEGPEPLHRLRVTARRMQTLLSLFRACLPAGLRMRSSTLKGLLDAMGVVRDADIRLAAATSFRRSVAKGDRAGLDPLLQHLQSERARARSTMLRGLDVKRTREWLDTLPDQLARRPLPVASAPSRKPAARNPAALMVVPDLIRERYRKLRQCARRMTPESSMTEFHDVRVRSKKLRYALEIAAATYGKPAEKMLASLHKLQSRLGTQHDADMISRYLTQLATHPPAGFTAATLFLMGRMAEAYAREAAHLGRRVKRPWRRMRRKRWEALRSRMDELRDQVPVTNSEDRPMGRSPHRSARRNGKIPSAAVSWSWSSPNAIGRRPWS